MAFTPFSTKGPDAQLKTVVFGAPSSPFPSPRAPETQPPLAFQNSASSVRPQQSAGVQWGPQHSGRVPSQPLAFQNSRPSMRPSESFGVQRRPELAERISSSPGSGFQNSGPSIRPYQAAAVQRPIQPSPRWGVRQESHEAQSQPRPNSSVASFVVSRNSGNTVTAKLARGQEPRRTMLSHSSPVGEDVLRNSHQTVSQGYANFFGDQSSYIPPRKRSPQSAFGNSSIEDSGPLSEIEWPHLSSDTSRVKLARNYPELNHQEESSVRPYSYETPNVQDLRKTVSPTNTTSSEAVQDNPNFAQNNSRRPLGAPPMVGSGSNILHSSTSILNPKRARSPPLLYTKEVFQGNTDGLEREEEAKAKRLSRFKAELDYTLPVLPADTAEDKISAGKLRQSLEARQKNSVEYSMDAHSSADNGSSDPSTVIIGKCPDMCPVSERDERERKGDLDQYERLDGDRNQTSKHLAIKKYSRTTEREANLIRPMAILQKTMNYLLSLLARPYEGSFLGMYNFLWDRMRAIRVDLRMQHIFNQEAITMLEQMIRLHIVAMHELCEYTKGEGFSEGFDAHLNIEQMNKTSVELFQMYDDHRKKGLDVPSEKEFRGYYALLKLDKHPGYKVEPAELSLDLAKMTPEIRQTPEVLFARDVARACRMGNFIAFFRLARKASYLQACLMHAHFAKLRTQALASLHMGLQNNQGVPVGHVTKWLGMEQKDVELLLDYHGFSIKEFEEPYMVKDGPFLNLEKDFTTKCSQLVHQKKSRMIVEDVSPSQASVPIKPTEKTQLSTIRKHDTEVLPSIPKMSFIPVTGESPNSKTSPSPKKAVQLPLFCKPTAIQQNQDSHLVGHVSISPWSFSTGPSLSQSEVQSTEKLKNDSLFSSLPKGNLFLHPEAKPAPIVPAMCMQQNSPKATLMPTVPALQVSSPSGKYKNALDILVPEPIVIDDPEDEELTDVHQEDKNENDEVLGNQDQEVAVAKLKLIIRLWRRWSSRQRRFRELRQLEASAALNSLSLGPPIRLEKHRSSTHVRFDIDHIVRERLEKQEKSWSKLNVSDVTGDILSRKNPDAKCLCWKIVLCSQMNSMDETIAGSHLSHMPISRWLLSKLLPSRNEDICDPNLVVSSSGVSIWKKWIARGSGSDSLCCLSVVKDAETNNMHQMVGAGAVIFLVSESISWDLQKIQLNNLVMSIPSGSHLPLLIASGLHGREDSDPLSTILKELALCDLDKSRVGTFSVVSLVENNRELAGFFSDNRLKDGIRWLASESPSQPELHRVKIRELVMTHLCSSMNDLETMEKDLIAPDHCIVAFNEALNQSQLNIAAAAEANFIGWPCPEIELLENSYDELLMVKRYLPSIGWSCAERVEPLKYATKDCLLPSFPDDLSWLSRGCGTVAEIENQRERLERCLIEYLTQSSKLMGITSATEEVQAILQRSTVLELRNLSYYIVPNWIMIFRRIFIWQLMSLSSLPAYVLESHFVESDMVDLSKLRLEDSSTNLPSLNEIIELVGCSSIKYQRNPQTSMVVANHQVENGNYSSEQVSTTDFGCPADKSSNKKGKSKEPEVDNFTKMLEQCNLVQNNNAGKLSIYF